MLVLKTIFGMLLAVSVTALPDHLNSIGYSDQESIGLKDMLALFKRQQQQIESLELVVSELKETVEFQRTEIARLERAIGNSSVEQSISKVKAEIFRSCEEIRLADPAASSGPYLVDPDGLGSGDSPISVFCDMATGSTLISHDSESEIVADSCLDPGCYSRSVVYSATMRQMAALTEISQSCRQSFRFDCFTVPFEFNGVQQAWWTDRNGHPQFYWADTNDTAHTCQCGIDGDCILPDFKCNCDSLAAANLTDQGYITSKEALPVTNLSFGRTSIPSSSGKHILGKLECAGRVVVDKVPESCEDLWQMGHTLNGFYDVRGDKQIRSVFCDFGQILGAQGIETSIVGVVDVKSSPVYFHVQRNSTYSANRTTIPFEIERTNVGGGMDLTSGTFTAPTTGTYFFSFSGVTEKQGTVVSLRMNSQSVAHSFASATNDSITLSLSSTLNVQAGDQVQMYLVQGALRENSPNRYTNFNGMLLDEQLVL